MGQIALRPRIYGYQGLSARAFSGAFAACPATWPAHSRDGGRGRVLPRAVGGKRVSPDYHPL
jgi:hypothetical protein